MPLQPIHEFITRINNTGIRETVSGTSYYETARKPGGVEQMIRSYRQVPIFYRYGEKWHIVFPSRPNLNHQVTLSLNDNGEYVLHNANPEVRGRATICSYHEVDKVPALELMKRILQVLLAQRTNFNKNLIDGYIQRLFDDEIFDLNDLQILCEKVSGKFLLISR